MVLAARSAFHPPEWFHGTRPDEKGPHLERYSGRDLLEEGQPPRDLETFLAIAVKRG